MRTSVLEEGEAVLADLELVAVLQAGRGVDPAAVQEGAVEASLVLDEEAVVALDENGVLAGDSDVVEEDVAVGRAADRRALALRQEVLACTAPARADDQRRILHGKIDILRAELTARLKHKGEGAILNQVDVDRLTEILVQKGAPPANP